MSVRQRVQQLEKQTGWGRSTATTSSLEAELLAEAERRALFREAFRDLVARLWRRAGHLDRAAAIRNLSTV